MFLSSFYCYLKYDSKANFIINLDDLWKWLDFKQKVKAKSLLETHFVINIDYIKVVSAAEKQEGKLHGGHNKETFMLNVETFKRFCLKAGTKKADEIHDYFIKLENILFEITREECSELRLQLKQIEEVSNKEFEAKLIIEKQFEREKLLLSEYSNAGNLVYVVKVKDYSDGTYVVKIGESRKGITERYHEHKSKYENVLLLNCFSVDKSKNFESFLHHHPSIYPNKCRTLVGHERENELFVIGTSLTYQILLKIIDDNIAHYNYRVNELLLENQLLKKARLETVQPVFNNEMITALVETNKTLLDKITSLEQSQQQILHLLNKKEPVTVTGFGQQLATLGPRLQKINPETLQLVTVYESVSDAMNDNKDLKRPSVMKAVKENTIYCGFRWQLIERNSDASILHPIEPTKETTSRITGFVAKLSCNKSAILDVYLDRKTAAQLNGYKSTSALDNPVKNGTITNGHYYMLYDDCDDNLISEFETKHGIPLLYKRGLGQFDSSGNITQEFACKYECIKYLKISDKTLAKCIEQNVAYNGSFYKEIGSKLKML